MVVEAERRRGGTTIIARVASALQLMLTRSFNQPVQQMQLVMAWQCKWSRSIAYIQQISGAAVLIKPAVASGTMPKSEH